MSGPQDEVGIASQSSLLARGSCSSAAATVLSMRNIQPAPRPGLGAAQQAAASLTGPAPFYARLNANVNVGRPALAAASPRSATAVELPGGAT